MVKPEQTRDPSVLSDGKLQRFVDLLDANDLGRELLRIGFLWEIEKTSYDHLTTIELKDVTDPLFKEDVSIERLIGLKIIFLSHAGGLGIIRAYPTRFGITVLKELRKRARQY